jgi:predicted  nucleic acid-binding Zn-ribbon protein
MVGLARAEENINQIEEKYNHSLIREKALDKKISLLSGHIDEINKKINASQYTMDLVGKVFWIAIMASIGVMASQIIPGVTA